MIDNGGDVHYLDGENKSLLMYACDFNQIEIVKILIQKKAKVNLSDKYGVTAVMLAAISDNLEVLEFLY